MPVFTLLLLHSSPTWHSQYYQQDQQCVFHILPVAVCPPVCLSYSLLHAVASTVGAILVFPGASHMELGKSTPSPLFLTGLGWALTVWITAPTFTACGCALLYLLFRNKAMGIEDPLHTAIWVSLPPRVAALSGATLCANACGMSCLILWSCLGVDALSYIAHHQLESSSIVINARTCILQLYITFLITNVLLGTMMFIITAVN